MRDPSLGSRPVGTQDVVRPAASRSVATFAALAIGVPLAGAQGLLLLRCLTAGPNGFFFRGSPWVQWQLVNLFVVEMTRGAPVLLLGVGLVFAVVGLRRDRAAGRGASAAAVAAGLVFAAALPLLLMLLPLIAG